MVTAHNDDATHATVAGKPLISIAEAADLAGLSKSVAYRLAAAGTLPGLVRLPGSRMLVRRRVLEAWLSGDGGDAIGGALPDGAR